MTKNDDVFVVKNFLFLNTKEAQEYLDLKYPGHTITQVIKNIRIVSSIVRGPKLNIKIGIK